MKAEVVRSLVCAAFVGMGAFVSSGDVYYWTGGDWGNYSNPANWLVGGPDGVAATTCPGAADELYNSQTFRFDLGGGSYEFGKWRTVDVAANWYSLYVKNGTLTAKGEVITHCGNICVNDGGVLVLEGMFDPSHWDGSPFGTYIENGGMMKILGEYHPFYATTVVKEGGSLVFDPTRFSPWNRDVKFEVSGSMEIPHGFTWDANGMTDSQPALFTLTKSGTMTLGGGISRKDGIKGRLVFTLNGGTVVSTGKVEFENVEGLIAENAALTAEVEEGASLDISSFSIGSGVTLTKTGMGTLKTGASSFANLSIAAGTLSIGAAFPADEISLADGVTVELSAANATIKFPKIAENELTLRVAANGITINNLPAAFKTVEFNLAQIVMDVPFVTCADVDSLERLRAKLAAVLPETQEVYVSDQSLVVTEKKEQVFTGGEAGTITDWNDPAGWSSGVVPTLGEVAVQGTGVVLELASTPTVAKIEVSRGATVRVVGGADAVVLPVISLAGAAGLEVASGSANLVNGLSSIVSIAGNAITLPKLVIESDATLNLLGGGGMRLKNIDMELRGKIAKIDADGNATTDGVGPVFGYADAGETTYFAFRSEGGLFDVHSNQRENNGQVNFVCPAAGGRVKVIGEMVFKDTTFRVTGWPDFGNRFFGVNNPTDEPFTVILDNTKLSVSWSFVAGGAAKVILQNGSLIEKNGGCANHGFDNKITDLASVSVEGSDCYFDYVGGYCSSGILSSEVVDALTVKEGGLYLVGYAWGSGKGVFVSTNGILGVGKQYGNRGARSDLLAGFSSARIEPESELVVAPVDKGVGNTDWERRTKFANIPIAGEGNLVVSNGVATKVFTVTVISDKNTCSGVTKVLPPVVAEGETSAETALIFADGANWAGTVVANGYLSLTNLTGETSSAAVTFGKVKLTAALPLRAWRGEGGAVLNDTLMLTDGFVTEEGDAGVLELVPQGDFELRSSDVITLGTFPAGSFASVSVKCGRRTLKVKETPTEVDGQVICTASPVSGFQIIIR